jgi:GMP synthase (glutamine-hydrolysing)
MERVLILQNGIHGYLVNWVDQNFRSKGFEVDCYQSYANEFPSNIEGYSGVFISGGPNGAYEDIEWIHREHEIVESLASKKLPVFGSCFGSQIIASALCGRDQVFRRETCEVGYKWIQLHHPPQGDEILSGLDEKVYMYVYHNDDIKADHQDMNILGSTELCPNHIWRYRDYPIWGIQGHPEIVRDYAKEAFELNRERLIQDGADLDALFESIYDASEAEKLIENFIDICTVRS